MFKDTRGLMGSSGYAIIEAALTDPALALHQSDSADAALETTRGRVLCNIYWFYI
jgi:hypothetical protein